MLGAALLQRWVLGGAALLQCCAVLCCGGLSPWRAQKALPLLQLLGQAPENLSPAPCNAPPLLQERQPQQQLLPEPGGGGAAAGLHRNLRAHPGAAPARQHGRAVAAAARGASAERGGAAAAIARRLPGARAHGKEQGGLGGVGVGVGGKGNQRKRDDSWRESAGGLGAARMAGPVPKLAVVQLLSSGAAHSRGLNDLLCPPFACAVCCCRRGGSPPPSPTGASPPASPCSSSQT